MTINRIYKKENIIYISIILLPFFSFLKEENFIQLEIFDISVIFIFQLIIIIFSNIFFKLLFLFFKKKTTLDHALISISIVYFYSFFFEKSGIKEIFKNIFISGYLFSFFIYLTFLVILFFFIYINLNKIEYKNIILKFIVILISLNYLYFLTNFIFKNKIDLEHIYHNEINLDMKSKRNNKDTDIYFIILDGMASLDYAEENNIIENKNSIINKFKSLGADYIENSISNYSTSYASIQSVLNLNYVVTEKSEKYFTYSNFFPNTLINKYEELPITQYNKYVNRNFYWTGNQYRYCKSNSFEKNMCGGMESIFIHIFNSLEVFYKENLIDFLIRRITSKFIDKKNLQSTFEILNDDKLSFFKNINFNEKNFFFMHLLKPHPPYNVNKNCDKIEYVPISLGYENNYKCVLKLIEKFLININNISKKEKIIVFIGDHGFPLDKFKREINVNKNEILLDYKIDRSKIFNLIYSPSKCQEEMDYAKSLINTIRFSMNCANNYNLEYLDNYYFFTYYEDHDKWGEVELIELKN